MAGIIRQLEDIEKLAVSTKEIITLEESFNATAPDIINALPANDLKTEITEIINSFTKNKPDLIKLRMLVHQVKTILEQRQAGLPLGIIDAGQLSLVKEIITNALKAGVEKFHQKCPDQPIDITQTKIFLKGSRARGYSWDKELVFAPWQGCRYSAHRRRSICRRTTIHTLKRILRRRKQI